MANNNTVGFRSWVVNTLYFNNLKPWVEKAETIVIALNGIVNANTIIVVFNNVDPLKIATNFQEKPARIIAITIENIPVIFNDD